MANRSLLLGFKITASTQAFATYMPDGWCGFRRRLYQRSFRESE